MSTPDCPRCAAERAVRRLRELLESGPVDVELLNQVAGRALGHLEFIAEDSGGLCPEHGSGAGVTPGSGSRDAHAGEAMG